ncbi:MAG: glycosyltransferase family 4 protein [Cyanobacteria bacterium P01_F01_bin.3]
MKKNKFDVAMTGGRRNYAVPRILYESGKLSTFHTDFYVAEKLRDIGDRIPDIIKPQIFKRLLSRTSGSIPSHLVRSYNKFGIEFALRRRNCRTREQVFETILWGGEKFGGLVARKTNESGCPFYGFNVAALEPLLQARKLGKLAVVEQTIVPMQVEERLLSLEREKFPDWERPRQTPSIVNRFAERENGELIVASDVICGSDFVRKSIEDLLGREVSKKVQVVASGVDIANFEIEGRSFDRKRMNVLTVGAVGLRKGSPYVMAAAKELAAIADFRIVGAADLPEEVAKQCPRNLEVYGPVVRSEIRQQLSWADIFLLPSICEGSALAIYEAMAAGLPILCTPNCGSVVRHGIDGFLIPHSDHNQIVDRIYQFHSDADMTRTMSNSARQYVRSYSFLAYKHRLDRVLEIIGSKEE